MGDTGMPNGEPGRTPDSAAPRMRRRKKGQAGAAESGTGQGACPALADLYRTHYRSLIRLAALLTGDTGAAEAVVVDSFVALDRTRRGLREPEDALPYLRRLVVARSRPAARHRRPVSDDQSRVVAKMPGYPEPAQQTPSFSGSVVVRALAALPPAQREAVVLTHYLDLTDEQAAAAMRVSQAAVRRHLEAAKTALHAVLALESDPAEPPGPR